MDNWFTVEKIDPDTYAISEYKHWEETHCYLVCGRERALLIDTGLGVANIRAVVDGLTALPIEAATTHVHWDHIGGHRYFDFISVHEAERDWLAERFPVPLQAVKGNLLRESCDFPAEFDPDAYQIYRGNPHRILKDGDSIELGDRTLTVLHTPGHSPGHCCFYEPERGYLYTGDLIYAGRLDAFYPTTDPVAFSRSVHRMQALKVKKVLPAHHRLDIPVDIIDGIAEAFDSLEGSGRLKQGSGLFDFGEFQIYI